MATTTAANSDKIPVSFAWQGPNRLNETSSCGYLDIREVVFLFEGAQTKVTVALPENIQPVEAKKFPFKCSRYNETEIVRETFPNALSLTVEQIQKLTVKAGFFKKGAIIETIDAQGREVSQTQTFVRTDRSAVLERPEKIKIGETYTIVVSSNHDVLSARFIKETEASPVINPGVRTSDATSCETPANLLDDLTIEELQSMYKEAFSRNLQHQMCLRLAIVSKDSEIVLAFLDEMLRENFLIIQLKEALEKKGAEVPSDKL